MAVGTNITAILIFLFLVIDIGSNIADAEPIITASPDKIKLGLTHALDVNCSVSVAGWSKVAALMYLTVSRTKNSQADPSELAIISDFSSGHVKVLAKESLTARGQFKSGEAASVSLHWDYPMDQQEGIYMCEAVAVDSVGRVVEKTTQVQVTAQSPSLADWKNKVVQMDKFVKQIYTLAQENSDFVKSQNEKNNLLYRYSLFELNLLKYKNHFYYLYKFGYTDMASAQAICMTIGGYLAEIDDRAEYLAIQGFLKSAKDISHVMIAGTDEGHEGRWTLPSGDPLPFTDWVSTNRGTSFNCIGLTIHSQFRMYDYTCVPTPHIRRRFLCEVPQV